MEVPRTGITVATTLHICGNARYLTHCDGLGIEPVFQCSRDAANPVVPQQELLLALLESLLNHQGCDGFPGTWGFCICTLVHFRSGI